MKVVLTGKPGVGKTTVVIRLIEKFELLGIPKVGFYTEEVREEGKRVGFRILSLQLREEATFAHIDFSSPYRVGKYSVNINVFEKIALPSLEVNSDSQIIIIDEIGKMELFSKRFQKRVSELFYLPNPLFATIPLRPVEIVDKLLKETKTRKISVSEENRDALPEELVSLLGSFSELN
jgi:nucleoside-triphosphatase